MYTALKDKAHKVLAKKFPDAKVTRTEMHQEDEKNGVMTMHTDDGSKHELPYTLKPVAKEAPEDEEKDMEPDEMALPEPQVPEHPEPDADDAPGAPESADDGDKDNEPETPAEEDTEEGPEADNEDMMSVSFGELKTLTPDMETKTDKPKDEEKNPDGEESENTKAEGEEPVEGDKEDKPNAKAVEPEEVKTEEAEEKPAEITEPAENTKSVNPEDYFQIYNQRKFTL